MNRKLVFSILAKIMLLEAALMVLPLAVTFIYREGDTLSFLYTILILVAIGGPIWLFVKPNLDKFRPREGFVTVALSWVAMSMFGALPFVISGYMPNYIDAVFETVSGFTTTGSTVLSDVEALPHGLLFWRSMTHWIGGMGVLVLSLAVLPKMGARSLNLLKAESPGPTPSKIVPKIAETARILYWLYFAMSAVMLVIMLLCGMNLFDALINVFGTAGTGGFSNYNASIGHFNSPSIDFWTSTFMMLFAINFTLYFYIVHKNFKAVLKNEEVRVFLVIVAAAVIGIAVDLVARVGYNVLDALRYSYFQVTTIISTTGYATTDFNLWPQLSRGIIVMLMIIGACAGSTGGGMKVVRFTLLGKSAWREIKRVINPRGVQMVKYEGKAMEETVISQVLVFAFMYALLAGVGMLIISIDEFSLESNMTAVISALSNIGPGLGAVGPMGNFGGYSNLSKLVLTFCMLAGRLEFYPMLMLFTVGAWKKN